MAPSIGSSSATAPASRKISARSSTRPSLASTGSTPTASTSSGIATPENGSASIAASLSSRRSKRSDQTVSSTTRCRSNTGTSADRRHCGPHRMDTMKRLHVELVLALQFDKAHRWSRRRLRDPLGVAIVVLLRLDVGSNIFRRHQPDVVAVAGEDTANVMGAAASHKLEAGDALLLRH